MGSSPCSMSSVEYVQVSVLLLGSGGDPGTPAVGAAGQRKGACSELCNSIASDSTVLCGIQLSQVSYRTVHSGSQNKNKRFNLHSRLTGEGHKFSGPPIPSPEICEPLQKFPTRRTA